MLQELKAIKSTRRELRQFAYVMATAGAVIGVLMLYRGRPLFPWFLGGGALFLAAGLGVPQALLPLQKAWMALAVVLGWVMTRLILAVLFYLVITPLGVAARLTGKDFLAEKTDRTCPSYWIDCRKAPFDPKRCENQF